ACVIVSPGLTWEKAGFADNPSARNQNVVTAATQVPILSIGSHLSNVREGILSAGCIHKAKRKGNRTAAPRVARRSRCRHPRYGRPREKTAAGPLRGLVTSNPASERAGEGKSPFSAARFRSRNGPAPPDASGPPPRAQDKAPVPGRAGSPVRGQCAAHQCR